MSADKRPIDELITSLKQERDELAVKIHLGATEVKEQWDKVTAKLDDMTAKYDPMKNAVSESSEEVWAALKLVAQEVKHGFDRIRKSL